MNNDVTQDSEAKQMMDEDDKKILCSRMSAMTAKFEKCNGEVVSKLNKIHTDVAVIKETCKVRGETCAVHVEEMDKTLRGNGGNGVLTRLTAQEQKYKELEKRGSGKEKFAYLVIGALIASSFSLGIALVIKLAS